MRGKKAAINTLFSLLQELTGVVCGFILPRLILTAFGSQYNGLTNSITQFLACAVLLRSGIGGATRAALYKPLAEENHKEFSSIVKATDIFMKRIGLILAGLIVLFAAIYPFLFENNFGWLFVFSLFLIIGASTFAESFFGITYLIVLQADQRLWVTSVLRIICYILNTIIGVILIKNGCSIHMVKLGSAFVYVMYPILLGMYVKKHYNIDKKAKPNNKAISQRWDAFWQQVAVFVMNNTDVMVLTIFTNMLEVSVYSVYNMVIDGLRRTVISFSSGIEAAFGNMIAKNENDVLKVNVGIVENIFFSVSTIVYSCASVLIVDFVSIYTNSVTDVNYIRPLFAYIVILAQFFNGIRLPYQSVVQAAGHYKQTKKGAVIEPILNITVSIAFVFKFGLVGVAIGTLCATIFRTLQYSFYMSKNIVKRSFFVTIKRIIIALMEGVIIIFTMNCFNYATVSNYGYWLIKAIVAFSLSIIVVFVGNSMFFLYDTKGTIQKIKNIKKR